MATIIVSVILCYIAFSWGKNVGDDYNYKTSDGIKAVVLPCLIFTLLCWAYYGQPIADEEGFYSHKEIEMAAEFDALPKDTQDLKRLKATFRILLCSLIPGLIGIAVGRKKWEDKSSKPEIPSNS